MPTFNHDTAPTAAAELAAALETDTRDLLRLLARYRPEAEPELVEASAAVAQAVEALRRAVERMHAAEPAGSVH